MKKIFTIFLTLFAGLLLVGQNIVVTTEAPKVVTVGEQFRVSWTVNSRGGELEAPEFNDFYKLMGPQSSYSQKTSLVNGRATQSIKNSFSYYLRATKEGEFTIGPAKYTEKKKEYFSRTLTIQVINADEQARTESGNQTSAAERQEQGRISNSDLYVKLLVNRPRVTMGEHIIATLKIYSRVNLSGIQEVKYPDFNGFFKTDLETAPLRALERENVNGQIYNTGVLQRFLLYPQKTGKLVLEPSSLTVLLQERSRNNDPFFGDIFSSFSTIPKVIATPAVEIEVLALPAGAPDTFYGSVGKLSLNSEISNDTILVNEAITLRLKISGNGNLKLSSAPDFELSPDIEIYDPKTEPNLKSTVNGTEGSKVFEYVLIPRHHGQFDIPPIQYSYFDPDKDRYITLTSKAHKFYARKGSESSNEVQVFGSVTGENISYLGRDIRYIHTGDTNLKNKGSIIISRSSFIILYISVFLIFAVIIIWRREHLKRNSDLVRVKNRKAARIATNRLKTAASYLKDEKDEEFFSELLGALWGYLSDKLSIPVAELSIDKALSILSEKGINNETVGLMKQTIEFCEYSRYSPLGEKTINKDTYDKAEKIIKVIENEI